MMPSVMASTLSDRGSASGLYLAFYFFGGLMGAAVVDQLSACPQDADGP